MTARRTRRRGIVPLTLRGRLVAGLLLLVTVSLLGTDIAAYTMLQSFFDDRVDRQLNRTAFGIEQALARQVGLRLTDGVLQTAFPGELSTAFLGTDGRLLATLPQQRTSPTQQALVGVIDTGKPVDLSRHPEKPVDVELAGRSYRVLYHRVSGRLIDTRVGNDPGQAVDAVVIALPLRNDQDTLGRLAAILAAVTVVALVVVAALSVGVLRLGLRPLTTMAATATAIARGDRARRVPVDRPHGEVGQLAVALNQAFEERQRAEDQIRRFVADASHELRTPLTTIRGWADLYFQGGLRDDAGMETAMTRIAEESAQVSRLVEELLLLARLDEQRPLAATEVDLAGIAREVIGDAQVVDGTRTISLSTPDGSGPAVVVGDPDRLRQVLRNLVGNALQHTPPGTPVAVSIDPDPADPAQRIRLRVADAGPGIAEADLPHLFERFYRSDRSHAGTGSGLGLAIVQAIVRAHHGTVEVSNGPGRGARFDAILPAAGPRSGKSANRQVGGV
jgi:two-component system OmpR family sensor kinase